MDKDKQLPINWETFLAPKFDFVTFYKKLNRLIKSSEFITPLSEMIFNVFKYVEPDQVRCVIFGEDPYPRFTSANGVAFWDAEINSWNDKTNGSSLKNILKALLVAEGLADYHASIAECRKIAEHENIVSPPDLFKLWLKQGVLLVNTSMTFAGPENKKEHFKFWQPFHRALIRALNLRTESPYYILWGKKAQKWDNDILLTIDDNDKIIKQGHPTFIHQFLKKDEPGYSPFTEIINKTGAKFFTDIMGEKS